MLHKNLHKHRLLMQDYHMDEEHNQNNALLIQNEILDHQVLLF